MIILDVSSKRTKTLTLRVDSDLNRLIEKAVKAFGYKSKSDYIREAVLEFLAELERKKEISISEEVKEEIDRVSSIIYV